MWRRGGCGGFLRDSRDFARRDWERVHSRGDFHGIGGRYGWLVDQLIERMRHSPLSRVSTINCVLMYFSGLPSSYSALEMTQAVSPANVTLAGPLVPLVWLSNSMSAGR